jgi:DNA-binding CsgD family transcriptional regulator
MKSASFRYHSTQRAFVAVGSSQLADSLTERLPSISFRLGEERGLVGLVGARSVPIYVPNVHSDPRWTFDEPSVRSGYFTPIVAGEDVLGVLALFATEPDGFSALHRSLGDEHAALTGRLWWLAAQTALCGKLGEVPALQSAACPLRTKVDEACAALFMPIHAGTDSGTHQAGPPLDDDDDDLSLLSERERDVVLAMCRGLRLAEIARVLGISHHTARNHLKRVFKKLGVHSQVEMLSVLGSRR